jgi:Zn-dependent peptidase ImmA (M78 family)/transcriptional regulator with XRE-family HTH domain
MSFPVDVNPAVLQWARESAGFSVPEIAKRIDRSETVVGGWESGRPQPSWTELRKLAKLYQRPIASLLLASPPQESPPPADFRTVPDAKRSLSPRSRLAIRTARWLLGKARELREQLGGQPTFLPAQLHSRDDPEEAGRRLRDRLGVSVPEQTAWRTPLQAFRAWRTALEEQGVFVFQFRMPVEEVRGFSLFEQQSAVIVVNQADVVTARIFTLFHEYAHVAMVLPGLCIPDEVPPATAVKSVETFCNRFAAAVLIPRDDLERHTPDVLEDAAIRGLARRYQVSRYVVLGRMRSLGLVSQEDYQRLFQQWQSREEPPERRQPARRGGPNRADLCLNRRGRSFVSLAIEAANKEYITAKDATSYLGVQLKDLRRLAKKVR